MSQMRSPNNRSQAGFTLVETLVAMFILAMISSAGAGLLLSSSTSSKQIDAQDQRSIEIDVAQALFRGDVNAMTSRAVRPEWGAGPATSLFGEPSRGAAPFLSFVRNGWIETGIGEPRSSLLYVSYRLEDRALIREVKTRPDAVTTTPSAERILFEDVDRVSIRFRRGEEWSDRWYTDQPQTRNVFPQLVEISVEFGSEQDLTLAALTGVRD